MRPDLGRFDAFAIDLDGVIWRGSTFIPGAVEGMRAIRAEKKPVLFLTNNGAYVPAPTSRRLRDQGIEAEDAEILTSSLAAARWLKAQGLEGATAFVLGPPEVVQLMSEVLDVKEPRVEDHAADVVVVGRDPNFSFSRLDACARAVRAGARLIGLNRDPTYPVESGEEPGTAAFLAAVETASRTAAVVIGKPELPMLESISELLSTDNVLMVGDRPESDVASAEKMGWGSLLVRSGVAGEGPYSPEPDFVIESIGDLAI